MAENSDDNDPFEEDIVFDQSGLLSNRSSYSGRQQINTGNIPTFMLFIRTVVLCVAFIGLGLSFSLGQIFILEIKEVVDISNDILYYAYVAQFIGTIIGGFLGSSLFDIYNRQFLIFVSLLGVCVSISVLPFTVPLSFWWTLATLTVLAVGLTFIFTGSTILCLDLWGKQANAVLQALYLSFAIGAMIGPIIIDPNSFRASITFDILPANISDILAPATTLDSSDFRILRSVENDKQLDMPLELNNFVGLNSNIKNENDDINNATLTLKTFNVYKISATPENRGASLGLDSATTLNTMQKNELLNLENLDFSSENKSDLLLQDQNENILSENTADKNLHNDNVSKESILFHSITEHFDITEMASDELEFLNQKKHYESDKTKSTLIDILFSKLNKMSTRASVNIAQIHESTPKSPSEEWSVGTTTKTTVNETSMSTFLESADSEKTYQQEQPEVLDLRDALVRHQEHKPETIEMFPPSRMRGAGKMRLQAACACAGGLLLAAGAAVGALVWRHPREPRSKQDEAMSAISGEKCFVCLMVILVWSSGLAQGALLSGLLPAVELWGVVGAARLLALLTAGCIPPLVVVLMAAFGAIFGSVVTSVFTLRKLWWYGALASAAGFAVLPPTGLVLLAQRRRATHGVGAVLWAATFAGDSAARWVVAVVGSSLSAMLALSVSACCVVVVVLYLPFSSRMRCSKTESEMRSGSPMGVLGGTVPPVAYRLARQHDDDDDEGLELRRHHLPHEDTHSLLID